MLSSYIAAVCPRWSAKAVLVEKEAVVGGEDDDRIVELANRFKPIEQNADVVVDP